MTMRICLFVFACVALLPQPAFAHGLTATTGMVYGTMGVLVAAFAASCAMPGKFWQACVTWIAAIAGGIACVVLVPMASEMLGGLVRKDGYGSGYNSFWGTAGDVFELILPATCIVTSFVSGAYVNHALRKAPGMSRFYTRLGMFWLGLVALAILAPVVVFAFFPGHDNWQNVRRASVLKDAGLLVLLVAGLAALGASRLSAENKLGLYVISLPCFGYLLGSICDMLGLVLARDILWYLTMLSPVWLLVFLVIWKRRKKRAAK